MRDLFRQLLIVTYAAALLFAGYWYFSPLEQCKRARGFDAMSKDHDQLVALVRCLENATW